MFLNTKTQVGSFYDSYIEGSTIYKSKSKTIFFTGKIQSFLAEYMIRSGKEVKYLI